MNQSVIEETDIWVKIEVYTQVPPRLFFGQWNRPRDPWNRPRDPNEKYLVLTAHDAEHREVVALRGIAHMLPDALR